MNNRCPNCRSFLTVLTREHNEKAFPNKRRCLDCGNIFIMVNQQEVEDERLYYCTHKE